MNEKGTNKFVKIIAIALLLPVGVAIPLFGIDNSYNQSISAQTQDTSLNQRIANYRKNIGREIQSSEEKKVEQRCSVVKANLKNLSAKVSSVQVKRNKAYTKISKQLDSLYDRLEAQAFETTELKKHLDTLYSKISNFDSDVKGYKQALDDLDSLDCTKKPNDFIVTLEAARRYQNELVIVVNDIRSEIANTVKPSLEKVKKQIQDGQTLGGSQQ